MKDIIKAIKQKLLNIKIVYYILICINYSNRRLASLACRYNVMNKFRKKYKKYIENFEIKDKKEENFNKIIWICWFQGMENAPKLVKECYESTIRNNRDFKVICIDESNFKDYVEIPEFIVEKFKKRKISYAHFSDILRLELLIKYGGIWVDATAWCSAPIPKELYELDLFCFKEHNWGDETVNIGNWFIISKSNSKILILTRDLLYKYWKKNDIAQDYFIFHLFFKLATEKYSYEYDKIPTLLQGNCHILASEIFKKYDEKRFEEIKRISFIHKLSLKLEIPEKYSNTYYEKISLGELK